MGIRIISNSFFSNGDAFPRKKNITKGMGPHSLREIDFFSRESPTV